MKNLYFSIIFGCVFWMLPLILSIFSKEKIAIDEYMIYLPVTITVLYILRMYSIVLEKAEDRGAEIANRLFKGENSELKSSMEKTYFQMLVGLYFIGPILSSAIVLFPAILLGEIYPEVAGIDFQVDGTDVIFTYADNPELFIWGGIVTILWLYMLENLTKITFELPIISIPLKYILPIFIVYGIVAVVF